MQLAAGEQLVKSVTAVQQLSDDGPGVSALRDGTQITVRDLSTDGRWPEFAQQIAPMGIAAMLCTPMQVSDGW